MLTDEVGAQAMAEALVDDQRLVEKEIAGLEKEAKAYVMEGRDSVNQAFAELSSPTIMYIGESGDGYCVERVGDQTLIVKTLGDTDGVLFFATHDEFAEMEHRQVEMFPGGALYRAGAEDYEELAGDWGELVTQAQAIGSRNWQTLQVI